MSKLLDNIEDYDERQEWEQAIQNRISESHLTILTHSYTDDNVGKPVVQLSTHQGGDEYIGEVVVADTEEDTAIDFFERQVEDLVKRMEESVEADE